MARYLPIKHPWVDSSLAPLYQVTFPASASDRNLLSYCHAVESWSTHVAHPVGWLMDLSRVAQVSAQQRAIFAKYMQRMEAFDRRCNKGSALIFPNALVRGIATAIFWLYAPLFRHRAFAERDEGLAWLREVLFEVGVVHPPGASDAPGGFPSARPSERSSGTFSAHPMSGRDSAAPREQGSAPTTDRADSASPRERGSMRPNQR
jgi:hypothetical protein